MHWLTTGSDVVLNLVRISIAVTIVFLIRKAKAPFQVAGVSFVVFIGTRCLDLIFAQLGLWQSYPAAEAGFRVLLGGVGIVSAILWARAVPAIIEVVAAARNSEARRLELRAKGDLIEQLLRGSADPIFSFDRELRFTVWNPAMERLTGVGEARALGSKAPELFPEILENGILQRYSDTLEGTPLHVEESRFTYQTTGEEGWYEANWTPLREQTGAVSGGLCIVRDITERKKREALVLLQQQQLIESAKLRALGEMAGGMAHEINTPVSTIVLKSNELRRLASALGPEGAAFTTIGEKIFQTAMRIGDIIQSLKTFARESSHDAFETIELGRVIREALNLCEARFHKHEIELQIQPKNRELEIQCRPVQIVQVLINLLNNSFDAVLTKDKRMVRISVTDHDSMVQLEVADNGVGIPLEMMPRLMQPFATSKGVGKGTGLGLSISKGIVEAHGGSLTVDSPEGLTCFSIWLPKDQS